MKIVSLAQNAVLAVQTWQEKHKKFCDSCTVIVVGLMLGLAACIVGNGMLEEMEAARINGGWVKLYLRQETQRNEDVQQLTQDAAQLKQEFDNLRRKATELHMKKKQLLSDADSPVNRYLVSAVEIIEPAYKTTPAEKRQRQRNAFLFGLTGLSMFEQNSLSPGLAEVVIHRQMRGDPTPFDPTQKTISKL